MVRVKTALSMGDGKEGGFLLGADEALYATFIVHDIVYVLEDEEGLVSGFSIVLRDATIRESELWTKKDQIELEGLPEGAFESYHVAYFEQLAVLPGVQFRTYAKDLALFALHEAFKDHELMFATVVIAPMRNLASLPFLRGAGFRLVGEIDEYYPEYGDIRSSVYLLTRPELQARLVSSLHEIAQKILGDEARGVL
jgi:ribosomal protein S18 acetylase RimI-like enzyme